MADFIENLFEATQTIVDKAISDLQFDKTVKAVIIDDSDASSGVYTVLEGTATYDAYTENTSFVKDDIVYVTIPNSDYSQQKIITGKVVTKTEPFIVNNALTSYLDITDNLIIDTNNTGKLIANHTDISKQEVLLETRLFEENILADYSRLAISAEIKTGFGSWKMKSGDYGIRVEISTYDSDDIYSFNFNNKNMFGDVYNFATYQKQTIVFDVSSIKNIKQISTSFYQTEGTFITQDDELIPFKDDMGYDLAPNLFLRNMYISLGYDLANFEPGVDKVILSSGDSLIYNKALEDEYYRTVHLTWIHWKDNKPYIIKSDEDNEFDYDIRWYRYRLSATALQGLSEDYRDKTGPFNTPATQAIIDEINILRLAAIELETVDSIQYEEKLTEIDLKYEMLEALYNDIFQAEKDKLVADQYMSDNWEYQEAYHRIFTYAFLPMANRAEEQLSVVIVLYDDNGNKSLYKSDPIIFSNSTEPVPTNTRASGVTFTFSDDTDGSYFIYDNSNSITDIKEAQTIRTITVDLKQNNGLETSLLDGDYQIIWNYPKKANNTMIEIIFEENEHGAKLAPTGTTLNYRIKPTFSSWQIDNTISCTIKKDGESFYGSVVLNFGTAGTNGSDATLVISWADNQKIVEGTNMFYFQRAIDCSTHDPVKFKVELFDSRGKNIDLTNNYTIEWSVEGTVPDSILESNNGSSVLLTPPPDGFDLLDRVILVATVKNYSTYDLVAKFPVAITSSLENFAYLNGPTQVIYSTTGYPVSFNTPYELFAARNYRISRLNWSTIPALNEAGNELEKYIGRIVNRGPNAIIPTENDYILQPLAMYMKNAPAYHVIAKDQLGRPVFNQPILVMQNAYPSATLNKWGGKEIELNNDEGIILAPGIAAGRKEDDNTFSGVMLGDWSADTITPEFSAQTGVYGFHHGAVSYAFKEDGTAFIGKSGKGRIVLDGNSSNIYNDGYKAGNGILIDLDEPYISFLRNGHEVVLINSQTSLTPLPTEDRINYMGDWVPGYNYSTRGEDKLGDDVVKYDRKLWRYAGPGLNGYTFDPELWYPVATYQDEPYFRVTDMEHHNLIYVGNAKFFLSSREPFRNINPETVTEETLAGLENLQTGPAELKGTFLNLKDGFFATESGLLGNFYFDKKGLVNIEGLTYGTIRYSNTDQTYGETTITFGPNDNKSGFILSSGDGSAWGVQVDDPNAIYKTKAGFFTSGVSIYEDQFISHGVATFKGKTTFEGSIEAQKGIYNYIAQDSQTIYSISIAASTYTLQVGGTFNKPGYDCIGLSSIVCNSGVIKIQSYTTNINGQWTATLSKHPSTAQVSDISVTATGLFVKKGALTASTSQSLNFGDPVHLPDDTTYQPGSDYSQDDSSGSTTITYVLQQSINALRTRIENLEESNYFLYSDAGTIGTHAPEERYFVGDIYRDIAAVNQSVSGLSQRIAAIEDRLGI